MNLKLIVVERGIRILSLDRHGIHVPGFSQQIYLAQTGPEYLQMQGSQSLHMPSATTASKLRQLSPRAKELSAFLQTIPAVQHAFAYGSGIFPQKGLYESGGRGKGPMLDFILAVQDPNGWHGEVSRQLLFGRQLACRVPLAYTLSMGYEDARSSVDVRFAEHTAQQTSLLLLSKFGQHIGERTRWNGHLIRLQPPGASLSHLTPIMAIAPYMQYCICCFCLLSCTYVAHVLLLLLQILCNAEKLGAGVHFNAAVPWEDKVDC